MEEGGIIPLPLDEVVQWISFYKNCFVTMVNKENKNDSNGKIGI